jgi:hypothetical protein
VVAVEAQVTDLGLLHVGGAGVPGATARPEAAPTDVKHVDSTAVERQRTGGGIVAKNACQIGDCDGTINVVNGPNGQPMSGKCPGCKTEYWNPDDSGLRPVPGTGRAPKE